MATNSFEITVPRGPMVCGYCGEEERFGRPDDDGPASMRTPATYLTIGYLELTGSFCLGVGRDGDLAVLVEARWMDGRIDWLPHLCPSIPRAEYDKYADEIAAALQRGGEKR